MCTSRLIGSARSNVQLSRGTFLPRVGAAHELSPPSPVIKCPGDEINFHQNAKDAVNARLREETEFRYSAASPRPCLEDLRGTCVYGHTRTRVAQVYVLYTYGNVTNCERPRGVHTLRALNSRRNEIIALLAEKGCRRSRPRRDGMPDRGRAHSKETNFAFRVRRIPAEKRVSTMSCHGLCHVVGAAAAGGGGG